MAIMTHKIATIKNKTLKIFLFFNFVIIIENNLLFKENSLLMLENEKH
jgi:hypothetical protein